MSLHVAFTSKCRSYEHDCIEVRTSGDGDVFIDCYGPHASVYQGVILYAEDVRRLISVLKSMLPPETP
jgi:hypothetical protein